MRVVIKPIYVIVFFFALRSVIALAEPDLSLDTNSVSFSAYEAGSNPSDQLIQISNPGDYSLNWVIYDANELTLSLPGWLNVMPVSGTVSAGQAGYVIVGVDISGLSGGTYDYAFDVVAPAAANGLQRVDVSLEVVGPILEVSSETFVFPFDEANFDTDQVLTLRNPGGGLLDWSLNGVDGTPLEVPDWLTLVPLSGSLSHDAAEDITLTVDITDLSRGRHVFIFEIDADDAQNSPLVITVNVDIGGVIYVPGNFPTIQSAIDAAKPEDMIVVLPGTYFENIDLNGKDVVLTAMKMYDSTVTEETILDGGGDGPVVTFNGSETSTCVLRGFTITNGFQIAAGGGILGGGSAASIDHCIIIGNVASWGAGVCACNGSITHCLIVGNAAYYDGGGLALCDGLIKNCTIADNIAADDGGGLFDCIGSIVNCIVWDNLALGTAGLYNSADATYSCLQDWTDGGVGNVTANPLFHDAAHNDYHLKSAYGRWDPNDGQWEYDAVTSPCIDGGAVEQISFWNTNDTPSDPNDDFFDAYPDPNALWRNELWPHGGVINMGFYGGTAQASMAANPMGNSANLNHDDEVGLSDFMLFVDSWLVQRDLLDADLDRDGNVDYADFAVFGSQWLSSVELQPPPAPTGLTLTAGEFEAVLDWDDSDYEYFGSYNVYRAINDANALELLVSDLTDSQYADLNLSDGTEFFYVVTVVSVFCSESAYSELVSVEFPPPPAPTSLTAQVYEGAVELDWDDSGYEYFESYNIYRSTDPNSPVLLRSGVTESRYTDDSAVGGIQYYYWVTVVSIYDGESTHSNRVLAHPSYELFDHFEGSLGNWSNTAGDAADWHRHSGTTHSSNTGPSSGANGSSWYIYVEGGEVASAGKTAILESPAINGVDRMLSFYCHMYGEHMGTLNVDVFCNEAWDEGVWSLSGQQQTSSTDAYQLATVDLSSYTGLITLRFRFVAAGGYAADIALDNVKISGVQSVESP